MLYRLEIDKFKQIEGFDHELQPVTAFVGTNNSGKSSVLQAIHSAVALAQSRLRLGGAMPMQANEVTFSISGQDTLYLPLLDVSWLATDARLTQTNGPSINMTCTDEAHSSGKVYIKRGKNRNLMVKLEGREVISRIENIAQPFTIYVPGLAGIAKHEEFIAYGSLLRMIARGDANMVLRNVLYALHQKQEHWTRFSEAVNAVFPGRHIYVRFTPDSDEFINVTVKQGAREVPIDCIGTGFLQTIQILSYVFLFSPNVILLDEPDAHLHPSNQRALAELLWILATERQTQVLLATHSRHLIDVFKEREHTMLLWMKSGKVQSNNSSIDVLTDLGAFDSAEGLVTQGIDFVVLTEDQNKKPISLLFEANGGVKQKFQVWAYKGCSKLDVAEALGKFIHSVSPQTKIIVHRDSDYMSDDDKAYLVIQFQRYGLSLFLPPTPDVEGVQSRLEHLKSINPGNEQEVQKTFDEALVEMEIEMRNLAKKGRKQVDDIRHKQGLATEGNSAIETWATTLDLGIERWRHGKKFLAFIRQRFQQKTGTNLKTDIPTAHLQIPELQTWIATTHPPTPAAP